MMEESGTIERLAWKTNRAEPEISLEWKDLKIDIKYCGNDLPDEVHEFVELFPNTFNSLIVLATFFGPQIAASKHIKH